MEKFDSFRINRFMVITLKKFLKTQRNEFDFSNKLIKIKHFSCQKIEKKIFFPLNMFQNSYDSFRKLIDVCEFSPNDKWSRLYRGTRDGFNDQISIKNAMATLIH